MGGCRSSGAFGRLRISGIRPASSARARHTAKSAELRCLPIAHREVASACLPYRLLSQKVNSTALVKEMIR